MGQFVLIMILWWSATAVSQCLFAGVPGQYRPGMNLFLMVAYFPSAVGTWLFPLYELIWGTTSWWQVLIGLLLGVVFSVLTRRLIMSTPLVLVGNLIGVIASLSGCVIFLIHFL
ncbi:hypothetical protein [Citrobacter braakii]|uniref:hypothetical protein n=1 Tax=Citrobacter braakii TaxID=57706 RepID=UPI003979AEEF